MSPLIFLVASVVAAEPVAPAVESPESTEPVAELWNSFTLRPAVTFHLLRERAAEDAGAPSSEWLGGFILGYERALIPELLGLEFAKPFFFNEERYDSPLEVLVVLLQRYGDFEPFVAAGLSLNFRVFSAEREEQEGEGDEFTAGLTTGVGFSWFYDDPWFMNAEFSYGFVPTSEVFEHELTFALGVGYLF